jgi:hypothetical protein
VEAAPSDATAIEQNPALQERESHKLTALATTLAKALRARGVDGVAATLPAESGVTVVGIAFAPWLNEGEQRSLAGISAEVLLALRTLTGQPSGSGSRL